MIHISSEFSTCELIHRFRLFHYIPPTMQALKFPARVNAPSALVENYTRSDQVFEKLKDLDELPKTKLYVALRGLVGIGKTELAKRLFFSETFDLSIWVSASGDNHATETNESYATIVADKTMRELGIDKDPIFEREDYADKRKHEHALYSWFETHRSSGVFNKNLRAELSVLFVFDGKLAPDRHDLFLPDWDNYGFRKLFILDTSRNPDMDSIPFRNRMSKSGPELYRECYLEEIELPMLSKEDGAELLKKVLGECNLKRNRILPDDMLLGISEQLHGFPSAITAVARSKAEDLDKIVAAMKVIQKTLKAKDPKEEKEYAKETTLMHIDTVDTLSNLKKVLRDQYENFERELSRDALDILRVAALHVPSSTLHGAHFEKPPQVDSKPELGYKLLEYPGVDGCFELKRFIQKEVYRAEPSDFNRAFRELRRQSLAKWGPIQTGLFTVSPFVVDVVRCVHFKVLKEGSEMLY
jgi:hypothetical protein